MNDKPKTKWRWRLLRWGLIGLAVIATLIAVLVTEEDWRGKRDWESYKHEWEAKGEKFDWQAFVPPSVPDDQNFFTAPIFTNILDGKIVMDPYHSDGSPDWHAEKDQIGYLGGEGGASITDLKAFQTYYRHPANASLAKEFPITPQPQTPAKDVLFALSKFDSAVEELRQASQRPYAMHPSAATARRGRTGRRPKCKSAGRRKIDVVFESFSSQFAVFNFASCADGHCGH